MLKEMDIFVRSHLSPLRPEQVALMRAGWERDKRRQKEPAAPPKRRRAVKVVEAVAPVAEARTKRRRRTAAEVAVAEAEAQVEAALEAEREAAKAREALEAASLALEEEQKTVSLEERAAALFKELPATEGRRGEPAQAAAAGASVPSAPRAFIPTPVRPKPVASAVPGGTVPPRPVASAAPGAIPLEERRREKGKERKKGKKSLVDQEAVAQNISRTLASIKGPVGKRGVHRREEGPSFRDLEEQKRREEKEREKTLVRVTEFITVSELANTLKIPAKEIGTFAFKELGQMVTINQRLDFDMIELIASAFGFQAVREEEYVAAAPEAEQQDQPEELKPRPPVVTVMGHVDHGKTSLLDYVRQTHVAAGEAGRITQHIGAYQVTLKDGRSITFLDTPVHDALTAMRAHGTVLEATPDPGKGALATILVQNGTLRLGDAFISGQHAGRVRAMYDERGQTVEVAGPSTPVQVLGSEGVPEAGDTLLVMEDYTAARDIGQKRQRLERAAQHRRSGRGETPADFLEVRAAMEGLLTPEKKEVILGEAEVRRIFKIAKVGTVAGCFVRSGVIPRTAKVWVIRDGVEVYDGGLASLKRFKDDVREVREGFECGIGIENFNDVKVGDVIEAYKIEEVARSLASS